MPFKRTRAQIGGLTLRPSTVADPPTPAANQVVLYSTMAAGKLAVKNDLGTVTDLEAAATAATAARDYQTPGTVHYYPGCMCRQGVLTTSGTLTLNTYRAFPWIAPRSGTIDRIGMHVTTAIALSHVVVALWSDSAGEPGTVLCESGALDTSGTGLKVGTVSQTTACGTLYWFTVISEISGLAFRVPAAADLHAVFGYDLAGGDTIAGVGWSVAATYASPTPAWPGSPTRATTSASKCIPFYRWSA